MSNLDFSVDDLRVFVQVVESGGFTAAGRVLGYSTKQVSRQIQRLESRVGARLLVRTTRSVSATDEGQRFFERCVRIIAELRQAEDELTPGTDELAGSLRVIVPTIAVSAGLGTWLRELRSAHPRLSIQVRASDRLCDLVAEGFDLQISTSRPSQTTFGIKRLFTVRLPLAAHASYLQGRKPPEEPADLIHHECLRFFSDQPQDEWTLMNPDGDIVHAPVQGSILSDNSQVLFNALHDGLGIGVAGLGYLAEGGHDLVRILDGWTFEPMPVYATTPPDVRNAPHVAAFADVARRGFEAWSNPPPSQ